MFFLHGKNSCGPQGRYVSFLDGDFGAVSVVSLQEGMDGFAKSAEIKGTLRDLENFPKISHVFFFGLIFHANGHGRY